MSVVVPVRDAGPLLVRQLDALSRQRYRGRWEVVVADNGSRDGSAGVAIGWTDRLALRVVAAPRRPGINVARNAGAAAARGQLLAFCDADDQVEPGWLAALVDAARGADLVGGRLDEERLNRDRRTARRPRHPVDRLPTALDFLPFAPGANFAIWADVLADLGGFDERFVRGNDDVDLSFRAQLAGRRLRFAPQAVVAYRHRRGNLELFRQFCQYGASEPLLFRLHHRQGLQRPSGARVARRWARLVAELPAACASPSRRGAWLATAGFSVGRVAGSVRERALFL